MSPRPACPDDSALRALLVDEAASGAEHDTLSRHLESCDRCRGRLEAIANDGAPWPDLCPPPSVEESALRRVIHDLGDGPGLHPEATHPCGWHDPEEILDFLEPAEQPGHLGRLGPYEVRNLLGRGGMSVVLRAIDPALNRIVAIKVLAPELATSAAARRRFAREAQAAAAVNHEHVVAIHAVDDSGRLPYLVMQYIAGKSLQERIDRTGPLEVREVLRIGMQAAAGLAAAHAQGLIHRDVKPANILLENGVERVKITDFGLARAADDASLTQSGVIAGTPQYMSPEQARGEPLDHRADLFSLGGVLYAMCTGRAPFRAPTTVAVLKRVCEDLPRPILEINPEVPEELAAVIDRLMAKDPADRFATAAEVAERLGAMLARLQQPGAKDKAAPIEDELPGPSLAVPTRSRRWLPAAAAVLLLLGGLCATEATAITHVAKFVATVLRIRTPEGTLVVRVDDPSIKVSIDGETNELVFREAEAREIRLKPGPHLVRATKDGATLLDQVITITRDGKEIVTVSQEAPSSREVVSSPAGEPPPRDVVTATSRPAGGPPPSASDPNTPQTLGRSRTDALEKLRRAGFVTDRQLVRSLLQEARAAIRQGDHAQATRLIDEARAQGVPTGLFDDSPEKVLAELEKALFESDPKVVAGRKALQRAEEAYRRALTLDRDPGDHATQAARTRAELLRNRLRELEKYRRVPELRLKIFPLSAANREKAPGKAGAEESLSDNERALRAAREEIDLLQKELQVLADQWKEAEKKNSDFGDTPEARKLQEQIIALAERHAGLKSLQQEIERRGRAAAAHRDRDVDNEDVIVERPNRTLSSSLPRLTPKRHVNSEKPVTELTISPDGSRLAYSTGSWNPAPVFFYDLKAGNPIRPIFHDNENGKVIHALAYSPDGKRLAAFHQEGAVTVWDAVTGEKLITLPEPAPYARGASLTFFRFSPDSKTIATAEKERIVVRDAESGQTVTSYRLPHPVLDFDFAPDGKSMAAVLHTASAAGRAGSYGGPLKRWDLTTGKALPRLEDEPEFNVFSRFSPDGKTLALGDRAHPPRFFDLVTGQSRGTLGESVGLVVFGPAGRHLAALLETPSQKSPRGVVSLWDVETLRPVAVVPRPCPSSTTIAFTPDGKELATTDSDGKIILWDLERIGVAAAGDAGDPHRWGTLRGRVVFRGNPPTPRVLVKPGDPNVKDAEICAREGIVSEELVLDPNARTSSRRGVRHAVVSLASPTAIHPDAEARARAAPYLAVHNCRFVPHVLAWMRGTPLQVASRDPVAHGINPHFGANTPAGFPLARDAFVTRTYSQPEGEPVSVTCDVHPWMQAWWFILDHPYFAVTDAEGNFEIKDAPAGEQHVVVWQEATGFLTPRQGERIEIPPNGVTYKEYTIEPGMIRTGP